MAFQFGSGTQGNPYLLSTVDDVVLFVTQYLNSGAYFALVNSIDASTVQIGHSLDSRFNLDGRGFSLRLKIYNNVTGNGVVFGRTVDGLIKNISLTFFEPTVYLKGFFGNVNSAGFELRNARVEFKFDVEWGYYPLFKGGQSLLVGGNFSCAASSSQIYKSGSGSANSTNISSFANGNPYDPSNYVGFDEKYWIFDGLSLPTPRQQSIGDLVVRQCIKGKTMVGGIAKSRIVAFYTPANGFRYKQMKSGSDGKYLAMLNEVVEPVIVIHYDDPGLPFVASKSYVLGDRIHPSVPNGYVYVCTTAGTASSTEPTVWPTTGTLTSGSALFTAMPIYAPASHLAIPQPVNIVTGEPA